LQALYFEEVMITSSATSINKGCTSKKITAFALVITDMVLVDSHEKVSAVHIVIHSKSTSAKELL
jgi:hypothetical protein